ncbi:MAG: transposase [Bdellovibrionales bacterium]
MHLVLRSSLARGRWSFLRPHNKQKIQSLVEKFAKRYGVRILSLANVGNHLHFHIQLTSRLMYKPFIRALTASIAMAVTGVNRWTRQKVTKQKFLGLPAIHQGGLLLAAVFEFEGLHPNQSARRLWTAARGGRIFG